MDCRNLRFTSASADVFAPALKIAVAGMLAFSGCSMGSDSSSKPPAAQAAMATKTAPTKPPSAAAPSHGIEELVALEERGQTILQVKFVQPINQYRHFTLPQPARIVLDILDKTQGAATDETFRIDTHWVSALRVNLSDNNLRLVTEIAAATVPAYTIMPENGGLRIMIGNVDPNITTKKHSVMVQGGRRVDVRAPASTAGAGARSPAGALEDRASIEKKYTGQKISLDFKDADIKNVFRLLAEVSGLNIIVTADVNRRVTLRLLEVPWDQALDLIIDTNGLGKEQIDNVLRISTAGALRTEKDALLAARRAQDSVEAIETAYLTVNYAKAKDLVEKVLDKIKPTLSPRGVIVPDDRSNTIVVRDTKAGVEDAIKIISRLDVRTSQVQIESNLIETTPTFARALGMELAFKRGGFGLDSILPAVAPFATGTNALGATFSVFQNKLGGFRDLNAALSAAETEGNIKIISRPSVVTLNNQDSTIKSQRILRVLLPAGTASTNVGTTGGSIPQSATEKIPVGIELTVTPQVSVDGFILMKIRVKSSSITEVSCCGGAIGDELNREAEANVLIREGETVVIGGIMKDSQGENEQGIPYLKNIPVLGWLFKRTQVRKDFEELMVFITPRLVSSGSENLPTAEQLWREQLRVTEGNQSSTLPSSP